MRYRIPILLLAGTALVAAFWFLDFHATASDASAGLQLATMRSSPPGTDEATVPPASVPLCVTGDAAFAAGVRAGLAEQFRTAGLGDVSPCPTATLDRPGASLLALSITDDATTWTPVYAAGQLTLSVAYSSDGDLSWAGQQPVVMPSGVHTTRASGSITVDDTTRGLSSRPAYRRHLGELAGAEIGRHFAQSLTAAP